MLKQLGRMAARGIVVLLATFVVSGCLPNSDLTDESSALAIVNSTPAANSLDVAPSTEIRITLNQNLTPETALDQVAAVSSGGQPVAGAWSFDANTKQLRFVADKPFEAGSTVDVNISTDLAGETGGVLPQAYTLRFSVGAPAATLISDDQPIGQQDPVLTYDDAGNAVLVWHAGRTGSAESVLFASTYDAANDAWSAEKIIATNSFARDVRVVSNGSHFMISWFDGRIAAISFDPAIQAWGNLDYVDDRLTSTNLPNPSPLPGFPPHDGATVVSSGDDYIVVWQQVLGSDSSLKTLFKRYSKNQGQQWKWSAQEVLATSALADLYAVTPTANGYMVAWVEETTGGWNIVTRHSDENTNDWTAASVVYASNNEIVTLAATGGDQAQMLTWSEAAGNGADLRGMVRAANENNQYVWTEAHTFGVTDWPGVTLHPVASGNAFTTAWYDRYLFASRYENGNWTDAQKVKQDTDTSLLNTIASVTGGNNRFAIATGNPRLPGGGGGGPGGSPDIGSKIYIFENGAWQAPLSLPNADGETHSPYIVADKQSMSVAWSQIDATDKSNIMVSKLADNTFDQPREILVGTYAAPSRAVKSAATNNGYIVNTWLQDINGHPWLMASVYDGQEWTTPQRISQDVVHGEAMMASDGTDVVITWQEPLAAYWTTYNETFGWSEKTAFPDHDYLQALSNSPFGILLISKRTISALNYEIRARLFSAGDWSSPSMLTTASSPSELKLATSDNGFGLVWTQWQEQQGGVLATHATIDEQLNIHWFEPQVIASAILPIELNIASNNGSYLAAWSYLSQRTVGESSRRFYSIGTSFLSDSQAQWQDAQDLRGDGVDVNQPLIIPYKDGYSVFAVQYSNVERIGITYTIATVDGGNAKLGPVKTIYAPVYSSPQSLSAIKQNAGYLLTWTEHMASGVSVKALKLSDDLDAGLPFTLSKNGTFDNPVQLVDGGEHSVATFLQTTSDKRGFSTDRVYVVDGL